SLRFFIQIMWENKLIPNNQFTLFGEEIESVGKNIGGWKKELLRKTPTTTGEKEKSSDQAPGCHHSTHSDYQASWPQSSNHCHSISHSRPRVYVVCHLYHHPLNTLGVVFYLWP
ncbi:MAG: four helix bundle protein, partial [Patescibacteria group bacterium]